MSELNTRYEPQGVESRWYQSWEAAGLFRPKNDGRPKFTVTIPPPNITGSLHMGHALCYPTQDLIGRYKRLRGYDVLILPGQDHAGIATQSVVSKQLKAKGIQPRDLGREKFVEKVWEWREESGSTILGQFRELGCAFDWDRGRFTLDEGYVRAVVTVFINWFDRDLIYRGQRVVNWDPVLLTSVSDIETERRTIKGKLYHIRYPFTDGSGEVVVATTRPETMLGDVAVAVHPSDARYTGLIGKTLTLPLANREIPLVADPYPDPEFGTGAVKITPAHDPNDFEVGVRQGLPMPVVLDERAKMTGDSGRYHGMDRYEARKAIVADLEEQGFLVKVDDHEIPIIVSERSGEVIEPLLSEQWFVRQTELAKPALKAVEDGRIRFIPERYNKVYLDWMENIRDWCISRQLWWGHRIPVYYTESGQAFAAMSWDDAQAKAGDQKIVRQDEDVLDTWFSSGLWPFATLGWPDNEEDLKQYYPTSLLVTDRNIIYLWVARMIMMGLDFCGEIPFSDVYIHATVLNEHGMRMSKSLGTGVDPGEVINEIGADALRFTLLGQAGMNQELRYSKKKTQESRNFCNKIWNATRFIVMNATDFQDEAPKELDVIDQWLLSRLASVERQTREAYEGYDMQAAANGLYAFFWDDFCDWYIEVSKRRMQAPETQGTVQWVLLHSLEAFLIMLHPIMPFITEELYAHLPLRQKAEFVMSANWPGWASEWSDPQAEAKVNRWFEITRAARALRAEAGAIDLKKTVEATYEGDLDGGEAIVSSQASLLGLRSGKPDGKFISTTVAGVDIHVLIEGLVDPEKEIARLRRELEKAEADLAKLSERLDNPQFVERAKPEVIERDRALAADLADKVEKTRSRIALFS
jgi:valyl-tRNA synthetase